jgi:hypothetical protein
LSKPIDMDRLLSLMRVWLYQWIWSTAFIPSNKFGVRNSFRLLKRNKFRTPMEHL